MQALLFVLSIALLHVHHHQCQHQPSDVQPHCQTFSQGEKYFRMQCADANADELRMEFDKIVSGGREINDLEIRNSDISGLLNQDEHLKTVQQLQLYSITSSGASLSDVLRRFPDLLYLLMDGSAEKIMLIKDTFAPGQPIQKLILSGFGLTDGDIDRDAFENIQHSVKYIGLRDNHLTYLPAAIHNLPHLFDLDLSSNPIKHFSEDHTNQLKTLTSLGTLHLNELDCQCHLLLQGGFLSFVKEKKFPMVRCSEPSHFQDKLILDIDSEKECKEASDPNQNRDPGSKPDSSSQMKVAVLALIVTVIPLFLQ